MTITLDDFSERVQNFDENMIDRYRQKLLSFFGCLECVKANGKESLLDDKGNVLRVSYIYLSDTMEIWFDQSSRSNREENRKAEINPCFIACK